MGTENGKNHDGNCIISPTVHELRGATSAGATNGVESPPGSPDVPFIHVTVDENDVIEGARQVLMAIRPHWNMDAVEFKLFTDGITNKLVGCFHTVREVNCSTPPTSRKITEASNHERNYEDWSRNVVLVRVYGNKTDLLIDRKAETKNFKLLHNYGFAPSLFATFNNGLAYEYVPGKTLTIETIIKPEIWILIAQRMAEMHKVESDQKKEPMLWNKMQKFLSLVPDQFSDSKKHSRIEKMFLPVSKLKEEFRNLYNHLEELNSPVVFAHNDLLLGNVIYTKALNKVTFIDYEYADYNFQGFDIGNHFTEFAGIDEIDYARYPSKDFQMEWLTVYLKAYHKLNHVNQKDVDKLYVQVNKFALASHFFWAVWGLIQTEHSTIDFDFIQFAQNRYTEYLAKKDTFLALQYEK